MIPKANEKNLLLSENVVNAVKAGKFHIWSVDTVEDGIEILTGTKCGIRHKDGSYTAESVFDKVRQQLVQFAESTHQFRKKLGSSTKKDEKENDEEKEEMNNPAASNGVSKWI